MTKSRRGVLGRFTWEHVLVIAIFCVIFFSQVPIHPANDSIRPSPSHQMSLPPGNYTPVPKYLCTCRKCGSNGKVLARATWYNHNPGGKKAKPLEFSQDQVDFIRSLPPPNFSERRKRRVEETELAPDRMHTPKRAAGSSSVRTISDHNICARLSDTHENTYPERSH